jgi:uncharacterized protein (TIGR00645 family)
MAQQRVPFESTLERWLVASRWLLAPFFVGLALAIFVLLIKFVQEFIHLVTRALAMTEAEAVLAILSLVDIALTGALVMIVIFSGYENFVSRIDHTTHRNWPEWMGSIDFTALKIKLLGSIVAISAIQLLKQFMAVKTTPDRDLAWYVGIHLVFVVSSVLLALSDRISGDIKSKNKPDAAPPPPAAAPARPATPPRST